MYVGPPSAAIDAAWHELIRWRYFKITEEEVIQIFGKDHVVDNTTRYGYRIGLDALHGLHCVDVVRKALDKDHYFPTSQQPDRGHTDHCIDHIRQLLMCNADMTPLPVVMYPGKGIDGAPFVMSDVTHTCRDWNAIRTWVNGRDHLDDVF